MKIKNRFGFQKTNQLAFIPTIGITWGLVNCKFAVGFIWLNFKCIIRFF